MVKHVNLTEEEANEWSKLLKAQAVLNPDCDSSGLISIEAAIEAIDNQTGRLKTQINKLEEEIGRLNEYARNREIEHASALQRSYYNRH